MERSRNKEEKDEKDSSNLSWAASFDIGFKNFAFCIEEFDKDELSKLPKIPKSNKYNPDGTLTEEFGEVVHDASMNGKVILYRNIDLTKGRKIDHLDVEVFHTMTDTLDEFAEYWSKCEAFIIEMQMAFRGVYNVKALKLGQHCSSYFCIKYGRDACVLDWPAYLKTEVLGAPKIPKITKTGKTSYKSVDKAERKKWSIVKASEILELRGEYDTLKTLTTQKKRDDLADTLLQLISWKILHYVDKSI